MFFWKKSSETESISPDVMPGNRRFTIEDTQPKQPVVEDDGTNDGRFMLRLGDILSLLPKEYIKEYPTLAWTQNQLVHVAVENLFSQLARGRVFTPMSHLVAAVVPKFVHGEAYSDQRTVEVPLRMVVKSVGIDDLASRIQAMNRPYALEDIPAPFELDGTAEQKDVELKPLDSHASQTPGTPAVPAMPTGFRNVRLYGPPPKPLDKKDEAEDDSKAATPPVRRLSPPALRPHAPRVMKSESTPFQRPSTPPADLIVASNDPRLLTLVSAFQDIQSALTPAEPEQVAEAREVIRLPAAALFGMIPEASRPAQEPDAAQMVDVPVSGLYEQLSKGSVSVSLAQLILAVNPSAQTADVGSSEVQLPLSLVVNALGAAALQNRISSTARDLPMDQLPDPFPADEIPSEIPSEPPAEPVLAASLADADESDTESLQAAGEPQEHDSADPLQERLVGVNINSADENQLMTLPRVSRAMAERIVAHRVANGPFRDVFALAEVPGIGRKTFRLMTGMPWNEGRHHRIRKLAAILGLPLPAAGHLPTVVSALANTQRLTGAVISDKDGFILASHGAEGFSESVSALAPQVLHSVAGSMKECGVPLLDSVTLRTAGRLITLVPAGELFLIAVHETARLTLGQWRTIERVAEEVGWLTSRRAYAGPSEPAAAHGTEASQGGGDAK